MKDVKAAKSRYNPMTDIPETPFIKGKAQFDGYEGMGELHVATEGPYKGGLVVGMGDSDKTEYQSVWCWNGKHRAANGGAPNQSVINVHVNQKVTKYAAYDYFSNPIPIKLTTEDAKRIKMCFDSKYLYPIRKDSTRMSSYPSDGDPNGKKKND